MRQSDQRGVALIMVLLVMTVIGAISLAIMSESRAQLELSNNVATHARAEMIADSAVQAIVAALLVPGIAPAVSDDLAQLLERYASPSGTDSAALKRSTNNAVQPALGDRLDGTPHTIISQSGRIDVRIFDERGKVDVNAAPDELIEGLLLAAGLQPAQAIALTDAIADFRDSDSARRAQGAEDAEYRAAGLAWDAADSPFLVKEDLLQVLGMTPELFTRIAPAVTVHSGQRSINPEVAARQVLLALPGSDESEVDRFIAARAQPGTPSQLVIGTGAFQSRLGLPILTISVDVSLANGARFRREATVALDAGQSPPYTVLAWTSGGDEVAAAR